MPAVRIARFCGFDAVAETFERAGLDLPDAPPPSFVLGAIESTPLAVARAYTVFATPGRVLDPYAWRTSRLQEAAASRAEQGRERVAGEEAAYLVRDLLRTAVEHGTARPATSTGSTSRPRPDRARICATPGSPVRPARWSRSCGSGSTDGGRLGLTGGQAAGPMWQTSWHRRSGARAAHDRAARRDHRALGRDRHRPARARRPRGRGPSSIARARCRRTAVVEVRRADAGDRVVCPDRCRPSAGECSVALGALANALTSPRHARQLLRQAFRVTTAGVSHGPGTSSSSTAARPGCRSRKRTCCPTSTPPARAVEDRHPARRGRHRRNLVRRLRGQDRRHPDRHPLPQQRPAQRATTATSRTSTAPATPTSPSTPSTASATTAAAAGPAPARPSCRVAAGAIAKKLLAEQRRARPRLRQAGRRRRRDHRRPDRGHAGAGRSDAGALSRSRRGARG